MGAFASTNIGDVSPNTKGPICVDTGNKCDFVTSTCDGDAATCIASGPGKNMFESTRIIAERIYNKSLVSTTLVYNVNNNGRRFCKMVVPNCLDLSDRFTNTST